MIFVALLLLPIPTVAGNRYWQRPAKRCSPTLIRGELPRKDLAGREAPDLQRMPAGEKLWHDVHLFLYDQRQVRTFARIAPQENVQMKVARLLFRKYDLEDPAEGEALGVFESSSLQQQYGDLVAFGMKGSRNHLRTFTARLKADDSAEYVPKTLSRNEDDEIVDSPSEKGGALGADGNSICGGTRNRRG